MPTSPALNQPETQQNPGLSAWHFDSADAPVVIQPTGKANPCYGESIPFPTAPAPPAEQRCSSEQQAGLWHRETPLLSSQVHDRPWQADVSLALAQRCLWSCLNNSSLRVRASLSKGMLHWELTARSPHGAPSSYGKRVWRPRQLTMLHCKHQAEQINSNAWHRPLSHFAPGVCSAAAGLLFAQQTQPWSAQRAGINTALWQALQLCTVMKAKRGFPGREKAILSPLGTHWLYDNNFFTKSVNAWKHKKALNHV